MKLRKIFLILIIISLVFSLGLPVFGAEKKATITLSSTVNKVERGDIFNVDILVDPQGELDTVRAIVNFPASKLKATHFSLGSLYPNKAPGCYIDNQRGILSQGGAIFGGKVSEKGVFGTITFQAISSGKAVISLSPRSRLIRAGKERINSSRVNTITIELLPSSKPIPSQPSVSPETGQPVGEETKKEIPNQLIVQSKSHPNQNKWTIRKKVEFNWYLTKGSKKVISYFYTFSQNPQAKLDKWLSSRVNNKVFENVKDGIWYFRIQARFADGSSSNIARYRVLIDTTPPRRFLPELEKKEIRTNEKTNLKFWTSDIPSGIDFYEVGLDGKNFVKATSPYLLENLSLGRHTIIVRAVDKAGNVSSGITEIMVVGTQRAPWLSRLAFWQVQGSLIRTFVNEETLWWRLTWIIIISLLAIVLLYLISLRRAEKKGELGKKKEEEKKEEEKKEESSKENFPQNQEKNLPEEKEKEERQFTEEDKKEEGSSEAKDMDKEGENKEEQKEENINQQNLLDNK